MVTKTITVTERAYNALKGMKLPKESFSETILRVRGKKSIWDFVGGLSDESADKLEKNITTLRKEYSESYERKVKRIAKELSKG